MYEPADYRRSSYATPASTTFPLVLSILVTLTCCQPGGIIAIVFAALAIGKNSSREYDEAQKFAEWSKNTSYVSIVLVLIAIALVLLLGGLGSMSSVGP